MAGNHSPLLTILHRVVRKHHSEGPPARPVLATIFKEMNPQEKKLSPTTEHSTATITIITVATVYRELSGRLRGTCVQQVLARRVLTTSGQRSLGF